MRAFAFVLLLLGESAAAASAATTIDPGSTIVVHLSSPDIRTNKNRVGDQFHAHVTAPYATKYLRGAVVYGHVSEIQSAGQGRTAHLQLALDSVAEADRQTAPISGYSTSIAEIKDNTTARKALGAGAGAAVGSQTVGRLLGGTLGSVVGLVGGAAGGYAYAKNNRPNFDVATGASMTFVTEGTAVVPRRQARSE
jgi:uncharacterized membrane protein